MGLVFLVVAIVTFLLAALNVHLGSLNVTALGLAFLGFSLAFGVPWPWHRPPG